jgi:ABC-type bacteriocin/lantibiotic exporter with double-glycine peptidase domain
MVSIFKKILKLLDERERKRLYLLFGIMTISGIIEVAGIVSILPFLSLITNPTLINDNRILNWLYTTLNFQSSNRFLIFIGVMVLLILIVSNILVILTMWGVARFTNMRTFTISRLLLSRYLHQPYVFFLNKNTSELGKNILSEVSSVTSGVLIPLIQIISRGIVALFIFIMLIAVEPFLALFVMVILGASYVFIYKVVKKKISNIGKRRFSANAEHYKVVVEAFGGIKQLKLLGFEDIFISRFSKPASEYSRHNATYQIISGMPRYIMEVIAFGGIISVVLYLLASARGFQDALPIIGLFAFAAYRIMPALQNIFASITTIRFYVHSLDVLYEDIYSFEDKSYTTTYSKKKFPPLNLKKELKLEEISFSYPGTRKPVIDNLNLKIYSNTSVAFVGKTGVGKTTIADIILGLLRPSSGRILIDGVEITDENLHEWQKNLGYIPQDIYLLDDTVTRNIAFGVPDEKIDMNIVKSAAQIANIHNFVIEELSNGYQTVVGERGVRLSGGQRQRIGIARALYHNPGVLILDEATSALDGSTENEVFEAINNIARTKTLIIIAHRLTTVRDCDVIYILKDGKMVGQGRYKELMELNTEFQKLAKAHL